MKKIVLAGLEGKMGSFLVEGLCRGNGIEVVAGVGTKSRMRRKIPIYHDLNRLLKEVEFDIYVDFTEYEFSKYASEFMLRAGKPIVIGTTGFLPQDIEYLKGVAKEVGGQGVIAPNFSIGAILLNKFAEICTQYFDDFAVTEYHHSSKKDNPSGTAIYIANAIDKNLGRDFSTTPVHGIRLPGVLATHHIIVSDETQKIELIHQSNNRHSFEQGILLAIEKVGELDGVVYG
ncbi:MAG: 4-hydroxy-tetrahydrodipicolinate reductase, partial [Turicibacter sp.]|nr:4-hydroxy-tetrahydrodipicolinate reductase [Turicibacter sp.]